MYVYYLHFYFYLIPSLSQGITGLQNSYPLSLHPVYILVSRKLEHIASHFVSNGSLYILAAKRKMTTFGSICNLNIFLTILSAILDDSQYQKLATMMADYLS